MNIELEKGVKRVGRERKTKFLARGRKLEPLISKLLGGIIPLSLTFLPLFNLVVSRITVQLVL